MVIIIKHVDIEGPGMIREFLLERGYKAQIIELQHADPLPEDLSAIEAIIILGGPMNVYEEEKYPFLRKENEFIKALIQEEIPLLGICLGAQLIAKALGARVQKAPRKEIGWHDVSVCAESGKGILKGLSDNFYVFQWHEDMFEVPHGAVKLAQSPVCPQAFVYADTVFGLQFHCEVTEKMMHEWIEEYKNTETVLADRQFVEKMRADAHQLQDQYYINASRLLENFLTIVRGRQFT